ncbi:endonuclease/exonuclease/phosphatase family protein [Hydrogenimonas sp.]
MIRIALLLFPLLLAAQNLRIASYNVENLFDLRKSGSEYTEYIPFTGYGWNEETYRIKLQNIARVICDLHPDIIGLQEVESDRALAALQKAVKACGSDLPYRAIADGRGTTVKNALLSRYPILQKREVVPSSDRLRSVLEVLVDVQGQRLRLFVNHWKSRGGPESLRLLSARALAERLQTLNTGEEYILLGDFNSDWREWRTIKGSKRLNDTQGLTGINHILGTIRDGRSITKRTVTPPFHYDLWLELPPQRRWSHNFYGRKSALDHILLPASMFDDKGINYIDRSFRRFKPAYLFKPGGALFRWQLAKRGHGRHKGAGYSDHLPIYAEFTTEPFRFEKVAAERKGSEAEISPVKVSVSDLYDLSPGPCRAVLPEVSVIYKKGPFAIIKERGGRAILVYKDVDGLHYGRRYRLEARRIYRYRGLQEITKIDILEESGRADLKPLLLYDPSSIDLKKHLNEVIGRIEGVYRRGYLYYGSGKKIKLYYKERSQRPENGKRVVLKHVRVGIYKNRPELVVD